MRLWANVRLIKNKTICSLLFYFVKYIEYKHYLTGLADQNALVEAVACLQGCQHIGMPESDILLAQCAVRLARAPKSQEVYKAMKLCQRSLSEAKGPLPPVPLHLRNAPTKLMKELGIKI